MKSSNSNIIKIQDWRLWVVPSAISLVLVIFAQYTFFVEKVDVPEPSTLAIFALGMMGFVSRRIKKQA